MVENPLFYRKIVPLNREQHKGLKVDVGAVRFGFARQAHMIPLVAEEFVAAARALPIVFIPGTPRPSPVVLLGLRPGENRFVSETGAWTASYVPAFIRRYPFIVGEVQGADPLVCIDEEASSLSQTAGEPLFLESGDPTPALQSTIKFVNDYLAAAKRTEQFVDDLQRLGLFRTITIDVKAPGGDTRTLHGVMSVDPEKLHGLADADFLALRSSGALPAIYAHLSSLSALDTLVAPPGESSRSTKPSKAKKAPDDLEASMADPQSLPN